MRVSAGWSLSNGTLSIYVCACVCWATNHRFHTYVCTLVKRFVSCIYNDIAAYLGILTILYSLCQTTLASVNFLELIMEVCRLHILPSSTGISQKPFATTFSTWQIIQAQNRAESDFFCLYPRVKGKVHPE